MLNSGSRVIAASLLVLAGAVMFSLGGLSTYGRDAVAGTGLLFLVTGSVLFVLEYATSWYADWHQVRRRGSISAEAKREEARV